MDAPTPNTGGTGTPNTGGTGTSNPGGTGTSNPGSQHSGRDTTLLAAFITILATAFLFVASSTAAGHGHDYDVKLQLVESISNAAANAASTAQEIGSGEIVHEATSPKSAAALIQQRSDQTQQDWQQESELVQLQIDTYFPGPAQKKLGKAWTNAEVMVDALILISGQVDNQPERTQYVNELRDKLAQQGFKLTNQQWTVLNQSPGCYVSDPGCSVAFHEAFKTACLKLAEDIQTYILHSLTANIQDTDTIFQPFICTHTPACNL